MQRAVGFDEICWLQELTFKKQRAEMPEHIGTSLLARGLIERKNEGFTLTARGRIALAKLA
jgi:hypothetical protein